MEFLFSNELSIAYHDLMKIQKKKAIKTLLYVSSSFIVPVIIFFFLYDLGVLFLVLFFVSFSLLVFSFIFTFIMSMIYVSEKPNYEFLYPKVVEDINFSELATFTYEAYPKQKEDFHSSHLYPLLSVKSLFYKITFQSKHQYEVDVYDAHVYNAGQKRITYLNGYYFVIKGYKAPIFQLNTLHNPHGHIRLKRLQNIEKVRAYVSLNEDDINPIFIRLYHQIKEIFESPSVSMSSTGNKLYIGITLKPMNRKIRKFDEYSFNKARLKLMQFFDIANLFKNEELKNKKKKS